MGQLIGNTGMMRKGFTLIEILVALAIIAIIAAVALPRLRFNRGSDLDLLVDKIATITQTGYERAIIADKVYRVFFNMTVPSYVELQAEEEKKQSGSDRKFKAALAEYATVKFPIAERFVIRNFYIKGFDEAVAGNLKDAWFYILPDGISQEIIINIADQETGQERGLVLNPFHVKFSVYDTFQKP